MERKLGTFGLADFFSQRRRKKPVALDGINSMVNWARIEKLLRKKLGRSEEPASGASCYPALLMFKVLLLQAMYNLSDEATEEALTDRASFARFVGISLDDDAPDHTTICRFRNLLIQKSLLQKLLDEFNKQLERQGKLIRKGVALDASVIESASRPSKRVDIEKIAKDREEKEGCESTEYKVTTTYSHDTDAAWLKKGKKSHYGYKIHAAVDTKDGFVLTAHATPANVSDTGQFERLVAEANLPEKTRVFADKGYTSKRNSQVLKKRKMKDGIMARAFRNSPLVPRDKRRNRQISNKRYIVERAFGTLKEVHGVARASYLGVLKVQAEFLLSAIAYNLKKALFVCPA